MSKLLTFTTFLFVLLVCFLFATSQLVNPCFQDKNKGNLWIPKKTCLFSQIFLSFNSDLFACNLKNNCNPLGTGKVLSNGCLCKPNVVGFKCDRCRTGYYDLSANGCKGEARKIQTFKSKETNPDFQMFRLQMWSEGARLQVRSCYGSLPVQAHGGRKKMFAYSEIENN